MCAAPAALGLCATLSSFGSQTSQLRGTVGFSPSLEAYTASPGKSKLVVRKEVCKSDPAQVYQVLCLKFTESSAVGDSPSTSGKPPKATATAYLVLGGLVDSLDQQLKREILMPWIELFVCLCPAFFTWVICSDLLLVQLAHYSLNYLPAHV